MIELVAKRYVKALMLDKSKSDLELVYNELKEIASAFNNDKFLLIIKSTDVNSDKKIELILSFIVNCSDTTSNLVKLLAENKRLNIIPYIVSDLNGKLAVLNNTYNGIIYTNDKLSDQDVDKLTNQFANKFSVALTLTQNICDYNGIKVDIDGLGVEIAFSKSRLKTQMINHIIKAI
jgi:F-type H+-transporting ATPase subunit delta